MEKPCTYILRSTARAMIRPVDVVLIIIILLYIQKEETPIDIACDSDYPKTVKVLTKPKYAGRFTFKAPWKKKGMRNSSSYAGISSHRSESMHSVSSFVSRSSACSDVGRCTFSSNTHSISEIDVDN